MVYFEEDYSTTAMYNRTNYTPMCASTIYNTSPTLPTANYITSSSSYQPAMVPSESGAVTAYYDTNNYRMYWPHQSKEEAYNQGTSWTPAAEYQDSTGYKHDYYSSQQVLAGHQQVGQQYPPCAMMPQQMLPQSVLEEELMKERQQGYGWISTQTSNNCKTRTKDKYRVVYTDHQRLELEKEFHYSRYITIRRKAELAHSLSLSERQVKIWFQNRRAKERKVNRKKGATDDKTCTETDSRGSPDSDIEADTTHDVTHDITHDATPSTHDITSSALSAASLHL